MEGLARIMNGSPLTTITDISNEYQTLSGNVRKSLQHYFDQLDGQAPNELYDLVVSQVEKVLLEMVLKLTASNQTKAAKFLGMSRGTLRKKMAQHDLL